ncbi:MAG: GNAT family N-acetyltransferase [Candidatus Dormibacteria bacterium]
MTDPARLREFLRREPVLNSVPLGILSRALASEEAGAATFIASVERDGAVRAAALRSNYPKLALAAGGAPDELAELTRIVHLRMPDLPCVLGRDTEVLAFRAEWERLTGNPGIPGMPQRAHVLDRVEPQPPVPGRILTATESDQDLVLEWFLAFTAEAIGDHEPVEGQAAQVLRMLNVGAVSLWVDEQPVAMAAAREFGDGVARIGPVYTVPRARRQGYGGAVTAAVSQQMLDNGCARCMLFTDLRNPTSNHVYQQLGYTPVADFHEFWFTGRAGSTA